MIMQAHKEVDLSYIYIMPYPDEKMTPKRSCFFGERTLFRIIINNVR